MRRTEASFNSIISIAAVAFFAGCTGGGGAAGKLSLGNAPTLDDSGSVSLSLSKVNDKTVSEWSTAGKIDTSSYIHFKDATVVIKGSCVFGVAKVAAFVDGARVSEVATCDDNLNFTWTKAFSATTPENGTQYTIELRPANQGGEPFNNLAAGQVISLKVVVDTNAPPASTGATAVGGVLTGGVYNVTSNTGALTVQTQGDAASGVISSSIENFPAIQVTTNATANISFDDTLVEGVQRSYSIISYDRAGNASPAEVISAKILSDYKYKVGTMEPFSSSTASPSGDKFYGGMLPYAVKGSATDFVSGFTGITTQFTTHTQ